MKRKISAVRRHFKGLFELELTPHSLALGFAIGSFIALLPTPGFGVLLALLLLLVFPRLNKIAMLAGLVVWNPLTLVPVYTLSLKVGNWIFSGQPVVEFDLSLMNQIFHYTKRFLVGNLVVSLVLSLLSYGVVRVIASRLKNN